MGTDLRIKWKGKTYQVPVGFTVEEYWNSLITAIPECANAKLIHEGNGEYILKPQFFEKG